MSNLSVPVIRTVAFKFLPEVTAAQKADRTRAILALYEECRHLVLELPRGGKMVDIAKGLTGLENGGAGWDFGFVTRFKSQETRKIFDEHPGHQRLKEQTDPLLEKLFVFDVAEEEGLGWT
ncbi:uncharacterized protein EI97DRAFT_501924 [Westerdykella ornata]|uniref:Stress-response A/B barrel domain-containing protein n=1 Tax=Westerdykella ornata TaxID=318751 RepID=A0A6A6JKA8_WESOR|nr:uncharacterized protein EI97DRAFT_501924 [Westerdykella ornata]KAF2275319.1 hypothetical protein EI97DRAFT_501924 [Westerdykella ornata]